MPSRILLFGAGGQLGHELVRASPNLGELIGLDRAAADLSDPEGLRTIVRRYKPSVVINAAAYTAVDRAESEPDMAHAVNGVAPGVLAEEAELLGARMVHFSSDYVFDGRKSSPYFESDATNPLSVYGRSKLIGEEAVAKACTRNLIIRTSWVVGAHGTNFLKTILRLATEREQIRVVADQFGVPTSAAMLADTTAALLKTLQASPNEDIGSGLFHIVPTGETNWYLYARYVVERGRRLGFPLIATPESVIPVTTAEYPVAARRPTNSRLSTEKLRSTFELKLPNWTVGVDLVLNELKPGRAR